MQELKLYRCEFCGTTYKGKENCKQCEKGHKTPVSVKASKYLSIAQNAKGYPEYVDVEMSDGQIVRYKR